MEGEPEAYKDDTLRSIAISPRERLERIEAMLVRLDEKLDVRFEGIEKRVWALEVNVAPAAQHTADDLKEVRQEHQNLRTQVEKQGRKTAWMLGLGVGALGTLDVILRIFGT